MKSKKGHGVVLGVLIALFLVLPGLRGAESGGLILSADRNYQSAQQMLNAGEYEEALRLFSELGSYQESVKYVVYLEGILAAYDGALSEAEVNFSVLTDKGFLDSSDMLQYVKARKAEAEGQYADALKLYQEIDVLDSVSREVVVLGLLKKEEMENPGSGSNSVSSSILGDVGLSYITPLPQLTPLPTPKPTFKPTVKPTATKSPYLGTVIIEKSGYMSVRDYASKDSDIIFRVHYGERYLCLGAGDDWYAILLPSGDTGYVTSDSGYTYLDRGVTGKTLSIIESRFTVQTLNRENYLYSQPKTSAKTRRISNDGTETTFYFSKDVSLACFGKTVRNNRVWYLLQPVYVDDYQEILWLPASSCEVVYGDPDDNIIPAWWYD